MAEGGREANTEDRCVRDRTISNTVEVQGLSLSMSLEDLETYFKNSRQSGGSDIEEVRIRDGVVYITFMEAEVAQRVISHGNHQIAGQALTVTLFCHSPPKHCYENKIFVQGLNSTITEESLRNFLETATEAKVREFLYGEEEGNIVVTLSDNIDIGQLRKTFQERSIEGAFLKFTRVAISNCILVQNIQKSTSKDTVLLYFENKRIDGGDVENVEMNVDEGYCLVYFQDYNVIDRVLSKSHKVDGADVEVHLHYECLGRKSSRKKSDPYHRISSPGNKELKISKGHEEREACRTKATAVDRVQSPKLSNENKDPTGSKCLENIKGKLIPYKSFQGESQIKQGIHLEKSCKKVKHKKHDKQERSKSGFQASPVCFRSDISSLYLCQGGKEENNSVINQLQNIGQQNLLPGTYDGKSDNKQSPSVSSKISPPDNTRRPLTTAEGIKIFVYRCSILRAPVDVIVNAANEGLRHTCGIAKVIADEAGREFTEESNKYIKENRVLDVGTSCITSGGNLKYPFVIHTVGPQWDKYSKTPQGLQKCMDDLWKAVIGCFYKAETLQVQSIALPAVSSGWHGVPKEICAVQYFSAVMAYSSSAQAGCSLKEIHFIDMDDEILALITLIFTSKFEEADEQFNNMLQRVLPGSVSPSILQTIKSDASLKKSGHPHNASERDKITFPFTEVFKVLIYTGDITNNQCKVMVTCENRDLKSQVGDVLEIDASEMKRKVICCIIPKWNSSMSDEEYKRHLGQCFRNILEKARAYESVAMPLIGKDFKDAISGRVLLDCLLQFSKAHREKEPIREVHLVSLYDGPIACVKKIFAEHFDSEKRLDTVRTNPGCRESGSATSCRGQSQSPQNYSLQSKKARQVSRSGEHNKKRVRATETLSSYNSGPKQSQKMDRVVVDSQAECVICIDTCDDPVKMKECGHVFCKGCIDDQFLYKPVCPTCGMIYGIITGNQPKGKMTEKVDKHHDLEGYKGCGMIEITYDMPDGIQGDDHPKPGRCYSGLKTKAYLPDNEKGQKVLHLLHLAFKQRLIFTIGLSVTTGQDDMVTWNDIHHKTNMCGGPSKFGYPDPTYLNRVLQELAAIGVTEKLKYQYGGTVSAYERVVRESSH